MSNVCKISNDSAALSLFKVDRFLTSFLTLGCDNSVSISMADMMMIGAMTSGPAIK